MGEFLSVRHVAQASYEVVEKFALARLEVANPLLHGAAGYHAVDEHVAAPSDSVGAVDGLLFYGGVPPRVGEKDVVPPARKLTNITQPRPELWKEPTGAALSRVEPVSV